MTKCSTHSAVSLSLCLSLSPSLPSSLSLLLTRPIHNNPRIGENFIHFSLTVPHAFTLSLAQQRLNVCTREGAEGNNMFVFEWLIVHENVNTAIAREWKV